MLDIIQVGDKVDIQQNKTIGKSQYSSKVVFINDNGLLGVTTPIENNLYVFFPLDEKVKILIFKKELIYNFTGKITKRSFESVPILEIQLDHQYEKVQRRDFYRLDVSIQLNLIKGSTTYEGRIRDISGGGLKIGTNLGLSLEDKICLAWKMPGVKEKLQLWGKVIWIKDGADLKYKFQYGIIFLDISEEIQRIIIKYIFDEQRKLHQKGLI